VQGDVEQLRCWRMHEYPDGAILHSDPQLSQRFWKNHVTVGHRMWCIQLTLNPGELGGIGAVVDSAGGAW